MIITKTPLRIGLVGGGTDLPAYADKYGGAVVNLTINKYIYIAVNEKFDDMVRVSYSKTENAKSWEEIEHPLVKASLELYGIKNGIEIVSIADIPGQGSGLGSSSSFTVGLLLALQEHKALLADYTFMREPDTALAENACKVEIEMCGKPIGKQDQYAAVFGGLNYMEFAKDKVTVAPIPMNVDNIRYLRDHLMLFYLGAAPPSELVLDEQITYVETEDQFATEHMHNMKQLAMGLSRNLFLGKFEKIAEFLNRNWMHKRAVASGITSSKIDSYYNAGLANGAMAAKICGAGGGGFMLFFAPPEKHEAIKEALPLKYLSIAPEMNGARVVHMTGLDD